MKLVKVNTDEIIGRIPLNKDGKLDFGESDLKYKYKGRRKNDDDKIRNQEKTRADRTEGYEVVVTLNKAMEELGLDTYNELHHLEELHKNLPSNLHSRDKKVDWIVKNYQKEVIGEGILGQTRTRRNG